MSELNMSIDKPIDEDVSVPDGFNVRVLEQGIDPSIATFSASALKFQKLFDELGMVVQVQVTRVWVPPAYYVAGSKAGATKNIHGAGDLKAPAYERENVFFQAVHHDDFLADFAVSAAWFGGTFQGAVLFGPRSDRENYYFKRTEQTKALEEIARCLS